MKKKLKWIIPSSIILLFAIYFTMTPIGALRLSVIAHGYPACAFDLAIMDEPYHMVLDDNQTGYSLHNPPFEEATQAELINWYVTKHGIFYTADYYGWG
ncbi:MAG: hypothetical protein R3Y09_00610 [Clostridia bacterium]